MTNEDRADGLRTRHDHLVRELSQNREQMRRLALEMRDAGESYDRIGQLLGVSHVSIWKWVNA